MKKLPSQSRSRILVTSILEATENLLLEEEYSSVTTILIAERSGVSVGSLYQYFPDKKSIITTLLEARSKEAERELNEKILELESKKIEDLASSVFTLTNQLYQIFLQKKIFLIDGVTLPTDIAKKLSHTKLALAKISSEFFIKQTGKNNSQANISMIFFLLKNILLINIEKYITLKSERFPEDLFISELSSFTSACINSTIREN